MKTTNIQKILSIVFFIFIYISANAADHTLNQPSGGFSITGSNYVDEMSEVWYINIGVNKPIKINYNIDTEAWCDYVEIYSVDNSGNISESPVASYSGSQIGQVSTGVASGRAMVVFYSDGSVCNNEGYNGFDISFTADNSFIVSENLIVNGNVGIGTTAPEAKLDVNGEIRSNLNNGISNLRMSGGTHNGKNICSMLRNDGASTYMLLTNNGDPAGVWNGLRPLIINNSTGDVYFANYKTQIYHDSGNITTLGNVGIGTTTPNAKLEVFNIAQSGHLILSTNDNASADLSRIDLDYKIANNNQTIARISSGYPNSANGGYGILRFYTSNSGVLGEKMRINANGNVSIGTTDIDPTGAMLTVKGSIHTREVIVDLNAPLADYVFTSKYKLMPLHEVEQFVNVNSHLPEMPSAAEVSKNGLNMGEMQNKLLQKVEELTLYMIDQQKTINQQSAKIEELEKKLK